MKICVAQTKPFKGDVQRNIEHHKTLIDLAVSHEVDMIVFPELSLTSYEPNLSEKLAIDIGDTRFDVFQNISDTHLITIGLGIPIKGHKGILIGMLVFQAHKARQVYYKKYLHPDEEAFFIGGENSLGLLGTENDIALAICYELSVPEHSEQAFKAGATIYIASVAKSATSVEKAEKSLSEIARKYKMKVFMSNCIGHCDNFESIGKSSVWNTEGLLLAQLNDSNEGLLIFDTDTKEIIKKTIEPQ